MNILSLSMISPVSATLIIIAFVIFFGLIIPVLDVFAKKFVSYRWSVVVVVLALTVGAVIDFEKLSEEVRRTIILGGLIIGGCYVLARTIEKVLANGWLSGTKVKVKKGDIEAEFSSDKSDE